VQMTERRVNMRSHAWTPAKKKAKAKAAPKKAGSREN